MSDAKLNRHGLPMNPQAERIILGSIVVKYANFDGVAAVLNDQDFATESHRRIFLRMKELSDAGKPIDRLTIAEQLDKAGQLQAVGGYSYLVSLDEGIPEIPNLDSYVQIVRDKSTKRHAIFAYQKAIDELLIDAEDAPELLEKAEKAISDLRAGRETGGFETPQQIIDKAGGIDSFLSPRSLAGIPTPWSNLNMQLTGGGFSQGQLVVIGGRPGAGKTALAANIALLAAQRWNRVFYVSLEMTSADILRRMICARAQVNLKKASHAECGPQERQDIAVAVEEIAGDDHPGLKIWKSNTASVLALRAELRKEAARGQVGMVVIDYLQLMDSLESKREKNRAEQVGEMSRGLKMLAMELKCPVICLSQLSREQEKQDRPPRLSDLRDSGSIEQDADIVLFPYAKPVDPLPDVVDYEIRIEKQRNGPKGRAMLHFVRKYVRFEEKA